MTASIQWLVGTLRLWPAGVDEPANATTFDWTCTVVARTREPLTAVLTAAQTSPPIDRLPEIGAVLRAAGFTAVEWERRTGGRVRWKRYDLCKLARGVR